MRTRTLAAAVLVLLVLPLAPAAPAPPPPLPQAAGGFAVAALAPVAVPTAIAFGPGDGDGPDLYATTLRGDVVRVALRWTSAGPVASGVSVHASGFSSPLGLAFRGDVLFVADSHAGAESGRTDGRVTRVDADGARTVIVDGLPNGRHNTNHVKFGPDGRLAITNGNPNDNGRDGGDPDVFPYSGAILSVDVDEVTASPAVLRWRDASNARIAPNAIEAHPRNADFASKVEVVAHGFRNVYGIAWGPDGTAYTANNGADFPSSQDALYKIAPGANYTFPYCYHIGAPGAVGSDIRAVPNPTFSGSDCSASPLPTALLGWHVCATGLDLPAATGPAAFPAAFRNSVYVAECGPFFPEPHTQGVSTHDTGHKIAQVLLDGQGNAVEVRDFLTGLALPTDVRFGPDGAMYVADAGMIYRVAPLPAPEATVPVAAAGFSFASPVLVVPAGTTVEWQGVLLPHTVTTSATLLDAYEGRADDPWNEDADPDTFHANLGQGDLVQHRFDVPGTYAYFCALHARLGMVGVVVVV